MKSSIRSQMCWNIVNKVRNTLSDLYVNEIDYSEHFLGNDTAAYPGHQPVLDPPELKQSHTILLSTSQEAYKPPQQQPPPASSSLPAPGIDSNNSDNSQT